MINNKGYVKFYGKFMEVNNFGKEIEKPGVRKTEFFISVENY